MSSHSKSELEPLSPRDHIRANMLSPRPARIPLIMIGLAFILMFWSGLNVLAGLNDYPIDPSSEARYGRVTQNMVEKGQWIVPTWRGGLPRLEKPVLIHWLQSLSWMALGEENKEMAIRLPSALATLITAFFLLKFGKWIRDYSTGVIAWVLFLCLPIVVFVGRLGLIDALMSMFWAGAIFCYARAFIRVPLLHFEGDDALAEAKPQHADWRWGSMVWVCMAGVAAAKGTPAIIPLMIFAVWRVIAAFWVSPAYRCDYGQKWKEVLWWIAGPLCMMIPIGTWMFLAQHQAPSAWDIWFRQVDNNDHTEGPWYFIPVLICGLFPAWAFWAIPGWHLTMDRVKKQPLMIFMGLCVILPFLVFSVPPRKLATYLLPCAGPAVILAAWQIRRWLDVFEGHRLIREKGFNPGKLLPDGMAAICIGLIGTWVVMMILVMGPWVLDYDLDPALLGDVRYWTMGLGVIAFVSLAAWFLWHKGMERIAALITLGMVLCLTMTWAQRLQIQLAKHQSAPQLISHLASNAEGKPYVLLNFAVNDKSLSLYRNDHVPELNAKQVHLHLSALLETDDIVFVIADPGEKYWPVFQQHFPEMANRLVPLEPEVWRQPFNEILLFRLERDPVPSTTQPDISTQSEAKLSSQKSQVWTDHESRGGMSRLDIKMP